jgi:hypothetical protein
MSQITNLGAANGGGGANTFVTDAGNAVPAAGILNVLGSHGINTAGAGNTVTIAINNAITLGDLAAIATGSNALSATTGDINIASGNLKLPNTTAALADGVISFGGNRFVSNYGTSNTFVGQSSGNATLTVISAERNTAIGTNALQNLTTGEANSAGGVNSMQMATTAISNTGWGYQTLSLLIDGDFNTALGENALQHLVSGDNNVAVGLSSLEDITTGSNNVSVGTNAGKNYTGAESSNIILGNNQGTLGESNVLRIGGGTGAGASQQNKCFVSGINGVTSSNARMVTINSSTDQLGEAAVPMGLAAWSVVTASPQAIAVNNGYISNVAGLITYTLPATSAVGDIFEITNINTALGWIITQAAGQQIRVGNVTSTLGAGGSVASLALGDSIRCVCVVADVSWVAISYVGNLDII